MDDTASGEETGRRRRALAEFLKDRRARLSPASLGIPETARRRAKGLLREEVAQRAGMSVAWYTWMEQARPINPSLDTLRRLAEALRLDATEAAHLIRLSRPDLGEPVPRSSCMSEAHGRVLRGLSPHPAYVLDADWTVLDWNAEAEQVFGGFEAPDGSRNLLRLLFTAPSWRALFADWETVAASAVAQFRAATATRAGETALTSALADLRRASADFARLWDRHEVLPPPVWTKALDHPALGRLTFDFMTVQPDGSEPGLRLSVYVPADEQTRAALAGR